MKKIRIGVQHSVSDSYFFADFLPVIIDEGFEDRIICKIPLLQLCTTFFLLTLLPTGIFWFGCFFADVIVTEFGLF